jgi:uncharacterized membrane protein (DUF485 family)
MVRVFLFYFYVGLSATISFANTILNRKVIVKVLTSISIKILMTPQKQ